MNSVLIELQSNDLRAFRPVEHVPRREAPHEYSRDGNRQAGKRREDAEESREYQRTHHRSEDPDRNSPDRARSALALVVDPLDRIGELDRAEDALGVRRSKSAFENSDQRTGAL